MQRIDCELRSCHNVKELQTGLLFLTYIKYLSISFCGANWSTVGRPAEAAAARCFVSSISRFLVRHLHRTWPVAHTNKIVLCHVAYTWLKSSVLSFLLKDWCSWMSCRDAGRAAKHFHFFSGCFISFTLLAAVVALDATGEVDWTAAYN